MLIGRRRSVLFARADKLFHRLRAARLDNSLDAEIRKLTTVDILIIDDFALRPLDPTDTNDFYELTVERHRNKTTIITSNREPAEWLTMTTDALLAEFISTFITEYAVSSGGSCPGHCLRRDKRRLMLVGANLVGVWCCWRAVGCAGQRHRRS